MRSRYVASVLTSAVAVSLAACGPVQTPGPSPSSPSPSPLTGFAALGPKVILRDARVAMASLTSVHVAGLLGDFGQVSFDANSTGGCAGSLSLYGEPVALISASGQLYAKAGPAYWAKFVGTAEAGKFANRWMTGFPTTSFVKNCNLASLTQQQDKGYPLEKAHPKVIGTGTVQGESAVEVQVNRKVGGTKVLWIEIAEPHYLLRATTGDGKQDITFSAFDKPTHLAAPARAVNVNSLK